MSSVVRFFSRPSACRIDFWRSFWRRDSRRRAAQDATLEDARRDSRGRAVSLEARLSLEPTGSSFAEFLNSFASACRFLSCTGPAGPNCKSGCEPDPGRATESSTRGLDCVVSRSNHRGDSYSEYLIHAGRISTSLSRCRVMPIFQVESRSHCLDAVFLRLLKCEGVSCAIGVPCPHSIAPRSYTPHAT